jgi:hypothetical protein
MAWWSYSTLGRLEALAGLVNTVRKLEYLIEHRSHGTFDMSLIQLNVRNTLL